MPAASTALTYIDASILVKSYVKESDSPEAVALIEAAGLPILFTHLHEIEVPNAIRLKRFRGELTKAQETIALHRLQEDLHSGRLVRPDYELSSVFYRAETLSGKHSAALGTRSLDLLHIAAALESGCKTFASFDERQRTCAAHCGLTLIPAKIARKRA